MPRLAELDTVDQVGAVAADETIDAGETTATGAMVAFDVELVSSDAADAVRRVVTDISPGATALTIAEEFTSDDLAVADFRRASMMLFVAVAVASAVSIAAASVGSIIDQQRGLTAVRAIGATFDDLRRAATSGRGGPRGSGGHDRRRDRNVPRRSRDAIQPDRVDGADARRSSGPRRSVCRRGTGVDGSAVAPDDRRPSRAAGLTR